MERKSFSLEPLAPRILGAFILCKEGKEVGKIFFTEIQVSIFYRGKKFMIVGSFGRG
jgi:hypothetical protein